MKVISNLPYNYFYSPTYDTLNLYIGKARSFSAEENDKGIYIIRDDDTDEIIGIEIIDFSKRNRSHIIDKLPKTLPLEINSFIETLAI